MESINHLTRLTAAFLGLTILALGIAAIWLIRMRKKNLKTKKAETEERGLFSQTDELVPIDEIGPGVIVTNGGKKFVVVLKCGGSDFYTKPIGEKVRVKNNYAAFISEFTSRVTYRIYGEDINMDGTVREYEKILTGLQDMLFETNEDYKALRKEFETVNQMIDQKVASLDQEEMIITSGNKLFDAFVNMKLEQLKLEHITPTMIISIQDISFINDEHLNIIISYLFDIAMNCIQNNELEIKAIQDECVFEIAIFISQGIENIDRMKYDTLKLILKKYQGSIKIIHENQNINISLLIPVSR